MRILRDSVTQSEQAFIDRAVEEGVLVIDPRAAAGTFMWR
jgi:hypothetical protein